MLGNELALWETLLAAMKLGVVVTPATTLLTPADLQRAGRPRTRRARGRGPANVTKFDDVTGALYTDCRGRRRARLAFVRREPCGRHGVRAGDVNGGDRSHAALLHVRNDVETEARDAHASELSGRSPVDDVLDRAAAWRSSLEHQLARVGQTRVELLLRAMERGGDDLHLSTTHDFNAQAVLDVLRDYNADDTVRSADRLAHAGPGAAGGVPRVAARAGVGGRAVQSRGH